MSEEQQEGSGWYGMGFLRELMLSTKKQTNQVSVLYADEADDGTISVPQPHPSAALKSTAKDPHIWIVRPKWVKEGGKWKQELPAKSDPNRWFRIEVGKLSRAFVGNVLAGPKGKGYLNLPKTLRVALRSGDFNAKVRARMFGALGTAQLHHRTMRDLEGVVGIYIASLMIEHAQRPAIMAVNTFGAAGRWAIIDHFANSLRNDGERTKLKGLRDAMAAPIITNGYAGVPEGLKAAVKFIKADADMKLEFKPILELVQQRLDLFMVDVFFKVSPEVQKVFAFDGRHRMKVAADRKILGGKVNSKMTKPAEGEKTKLNALPPLNTRKKRAWIIEQNLAFRIYRAARQASTMPEDMKGGVIGFRVGGQGGQRSAPATAADGSITMFLTPMQALADAAKRGETSTILWCARFSKPTVSAHTATVSGIPKQGFTYIDIGKLLETHPYSMSQYLYRAAYDKAEPDQKDHLSNISVTFTLSGPNPSYKPKLKLITGAELATQPEPVIRDYLRIAWVSSEQSQVHASFWASSMVIEHVASDDFMPEFGHLMFGSALQAELTACKNGKQRAWVMYRWIDGSFTSAISSFALVEAIKVMHQKGVVVTQ